MQKEYIKTNDITLSIGGRNSYNLSIKLLTKNKHGSQQKTDNH